MEQNKVKEKFQLLHEVMVMKLDLIRNYINKEMPTFAMAEIKDLENYLGMQLDNIYELLPTERTL